jgi:hypothetical protein
MTQAAELLNPFPGLRPFEPDEDHLFFGREKETDELLERLRTSRFLAVVGTSGCGKSSLVRSGLIPSLHGGFMAKAGSNWRVSLLRPGEDPIGHLVKALDIPEVIGSTYEALASTSRVVMEAALRRGTLGLIDAVREARIPADDNLLIVIDQFEELFRFQRSRHVENAREEAVAFVKLLLEATAQQEIPIYIVVTMRSDFIGDCIDYPGLPEAMNAGQYLVPRLTRDQLRSAITGPVAVAGGQIAPRLVLRLLNDLGNDHDQLPVLQHALLRTWDHWKENQPPDKPLDIDDYEAVGTLRDALSRHAEEAYLEAISIARPTTVELIFKALTETFADPRGVRRPRSIEQLAEIAHVPEAEVIRVVEVFRRPGRSFLMPPSTVPLSSRAIVDLSHESLMRCWTRLIAWAEEERASAAVYLRLTRAAAWFEEGTAGLWRDPELELGLKWRRENSPTLAWAQRYDSSFERAMSFLDRSAAERDRLAAQRRAERRRQWRQLQGIAAVLAVLLAVAAIAWTIAQRENARAEENLRLARAAVDESLIVTERDPANLGMDTPQLIGFRRQLLVRAQNFYREFIKQAPASEEIRREMALAHFKLGHINKGLDAYEDAASEFQQAIEQFGALAREFPSHRDYRQALANSHNWLGESFRLLGDRHADAKKAYDSALALQEELCRQDSANQEYQQELARTYYNRGILSSLDDSEKSFTLSETDFLNAIRLLEPLAEKRGGLASQELARVYNNLGSLIADDQRRLAEAQRLYERATQIHEALTKQEPENREYKVELAKFYNNLAGVLRESGQSDLAQQRNGQAFALIESLARPPASLSIEQADAHNLRGQILDVGGWREALNEYRQSLAIFRRLEKDPRARLLVDFQYRFYDLLASLAILHQQYPDNDEVHEVLIEAAYYHLSLAEQIASSGTPAEARRLVETVASLMPVLLDDDRERLGPMYEALQSKLAARAAAK